jgi:hypothetical protein
MLGACVGMNPYVLVHKTRLANPAVAQDDDLGYVSCLRYHVAE